MLLTTPTISPPPSLPPLSRDPVDTFSTMKPQNLSPLGFKHSGRTVFCPFYIINHQSHQYEFLCFLREPTDMDEDDKDESKRSAALQVNLIILH